MRNAVPLFALCLAVACADRSAPATAPDFEIPLVFNHAHGARPADNFTAPSSGDQEVPARDTRARGNATFHVNDDGTIDYKLIVANIENVVASHIHVAPRGVNGPVTVFLYGPRPPNGGRLDGVIAEGTITNASLIGPLAGKTLPDLLALMRSGDTYVNVHTNDGVAPTNTGPGDFPGGEVRGQIMSGHAH